MVAEHFVTESGTGPVPGRTVGSGWLVRLAGIACSRHGLFSRPIVHVL